MYLIAIAWFYVALIAAISDDTVLGGVLTFLFYGLAPIALFVWLFGSSARRRRREEREAAEALNDRGDSGAEQ